MSGGPKIWLQIIQYFWLGIQSNQFKRLSKKTDLPVIDLGDKINVVIYLELPKEVGEGLFGVSFKMKGPKGNIKTTINPIRTLTPRFIQKIIDKKKSD